MVLLHGTSLAIDAWATWHRTIPFLAQRFRVFAPDMIGFGGTDPARNGTHADRIERSGFIRSFLDALALERCSLVGHSEGAFVATKLAIDQPDRIAHLAIVTSGATAPKLGTDQDHLWRAAAAKAYGVADGCRTEDAFIRTISGLSVTNPPEYLQILRSNYRAAVATDQFLRLSVFSADCRDYTRYTLLQEEVIHPYLSAVKARALLIWAAEDDTVPVERGKRLLDLIPGADMYVLARAAHMVMIDRPDAFNRLLSDFLLAE